MESKANHLHGVGHAVNVSGHESNAIIWYRLVRQLRSTLLAADDVG